MKQLIIAEKAKAARALRDGLYENKFESHIGDNGLTGYYESEKQIITFARGHLVKMYDIDDYVGEKQKWSMDNLPFFPENFKYKPIPNDATAQKQLKIIKELIHRKDVGEIIHYGDPDREGELLIRLILAYNKNTKPVKRLWCLAILPEAAREAYFNLIDDKQYDSWFQEGLARQRLDWLWGINFSRFLSLKTNTLMPAGRVLVPIVKFIYDRDMKIKNFNKETSWGVEGVFNKNGKEFTLRNKDLLFDADKKSDAEKISQILNSKKTVIRKLEVEDISKTPNKLFSLLTLQGLLNKQYGMSMDESMKLIQNLYLNGFLTYPRTPTEYIGSTEVENTKKIVNNLISDGYKLKFHTNKSVFDDSKCEGHTALIITSKKPKPGELTEQEQKVYDTVLNRFVSNFCKEKVEIKETTATLKNGNYEFKLIGEKIIKKGFLEYEPRTIKSELPDFKEGEEISAVYSVVEKESVPPKKVTVAELNSYLKNPYRDKIKDMNSDDELYKMLSEGCTIGTEATTTSIINNAIKYEYISSKKTTYSIEEKGIMFIEALDKLNINLYKDKNIEFNKELKSIYNLNKTVPDAIKHNEIEISDIIENGRNIEVKKAAYTGSKQKLKVVGVCPRCGKDIVEGKKAYGCTGYRDNPSCNFAIWKSNKLLESQGKKLTLTMVKSLLLKGKFSVKGLTSQKTGKQYDATFIMDDTGTYVNLKMEFSNKKKKG